MQDNFGQFIKKHRVLSGYKSQNRLGNESGISVATISRIESGMQIPNLETIGVLSNYLVSTSFEELCSVAGYRRSKADKSKKLIEMTNKNVFESFDFRVDGESITEDEMKAMIAYLRTFRNMDRK